MRGVDLAYIGRAEEGVAQLRQALQRAEDIGDHWGLDRVYINFTDTLTMLGRLRESARLGQTGLEAMRRYGVYSPVLVSNLIEVLHASGDWDEAERLSAAALRGVTSSFPYALFIVRALVEVDRGEFDAARTHFEAAEVTLREDRGLGLYDGWLADLALWEHRWTEAIAAIEKGLAYARQREAAQIRVQVCAKGLRTQAELAAIARARRDADGLRDRLNRAQELLAIARSAAAEAAAITPNAGGWLALCEAEYMRTRGRGATGGLGRKQPRPGTSSSDRPSPPTAGGGKPRRSSRPVRPAPRRARRSGKLTPSPLGSGRSRCCASSSGSQSAGPRSLVTRSGHARRAGEPRGRPRADAARGQGPDPRLPRLHQPRDRGRARNQRQDRQRPRLAHPPQARRAQPTRSRGHRPSPRPTRHRAAVASHGRVP